MLTIYFDYVVSNKIKIGYLIKVNILIVSYLSIKITYDLK